MQNVKNSCHQIGIKTGIQDVNKATACILGTVRYAENEAGIISDFSSYQDMLQPNFTEEEIAHIYQLFMEHPSETVKKNCMLSI